MEQLILDMDGGGTCHNGKNYGGGASHVALISGTIAEITVDNLDKILVVAGGGGSGGTGTVNQSCSGNGGSARTSGSEWLFCIRWWVDAYRWHWRNV